MVQQRLVVRERRPHPGQFGLRVQQPLQGAQVPGVDGVRGQLEPGVHQVVRMGHRVRPVGVPVVLGDDLPGGVDGQRFRWSLCRHAGDVQHVDRFTPAPGVGIEQQAGLHMHPAVDRDGVHVQARGQES